MLTYSSGPNLFQKENSTPHGLIRNCTFINFSKKIEEKTFPKKLYWSKIGRVFKVIIFKMGIESFQKAFKIVA